ncbi:MAG: SCO family protein [Alphaproteobacteria bacterium]|nr:SCO family protein [Alphaproteobacteria bacterium]
MRPILIVLVVLGAIVGGATALLMMSSSQDPNFGQTVRSTGKALIGGPFSLIDHTGKRVTNNDFRGKKMLIYFGFTHCPDICPGSLQVISAALDKLGSQADAVTPIFMTVDPERDTQKVMAEYVASFHPRLVGLTGTKDEIEQTVKKTYRIYYKKVANPDQPDAYTVDHASMIYLMDERGEFVKFFAHPTSADDLAEQMRPYL